MSLVDKLAPPPNVPRAPIRNPFRCKMRRHHFDVVIRCYDQRHRDIVRPSGYRCNGNSIASYFWHGYDNVRANAWDAASKEMMAYVSWRAGREVALAEAKVAAPKES